MRTSSHPHTQISLSAYFDLDWEGDAPPPWPQDDEWDFARLNCLRGVVDPFDEGLSSRAEAKHRSRVPPPPDPHNLD